MRLQRPFGLITPTVDGAVLAVLARTESAFTAAQIHQIAGEYSLAGIRKAVARLVGEGIVTEDLAGRTRLFSLNRDHLGASAVIELAGLPDRLVAALRERLAEFRTPPVYASIFGSAARDSMDLDSDIDLLLIRPDAIAAADGTWSTDVDDLCNAVGRWTGNDTRVLEYSEMELADALSKAERVLDDIWAEGIRIRGRADYLRGSST